MCFSHLFTVRKKNPTYIKELEVGLAESKAGRSHGKAWWKKAAHLMAAEKEGAQEPEVGGPDVAFKITL